MKEDFCGICAAIPLAVAGLGAGGGISAASRSSTAAEYDDRKTLIVAVSALFVVVGVIFLASSWNCASCAVVYS